MLSGNLSARRALDGVTGQRLPDVSDVLANAGLSYSPFKWLSLDVHLVFESPRSRQPGDNPVVDGAPSDPARLAIVPAIYDLRTAVVFKELKAGPIGFEVALIARNLLNMTQLDPSPLYTGPGSATIPTDYPRPGIYGGALVTFRYGELGKVAVNH